MAKILLIQPHENIKKEVKDPLHTPLSLILLATAIKKQHEVKIYDRNINYDDKNILGLIKEYCPDIIGFTSMTSQMLFDIMYLGPIIKKVIPKIVIIVGGVHATVEPDSVLNEP